MTGAAVLVSQNHWDYYGDEEVSATTHSDALDKTTYSGCGTLTYPHNRIASKPGTIHNYGVSRSVIWRRKYAYDRLFGSAPPWIGSNPTMIDLINWSE